MKINLWKFSEKEIKIDKVIPQTRHQTSGRVRYVFTVELLALKKSGFFTFSGSKKFF